MCCMLVFYSFVYFEPVECFNVVVFGGFSNNTGDILEKSREPAY